MAHYDYPFWSIAGLILVLLPAPWHWRARNIATLSLIGWMALCNFCLMINTIVWFDNYGDHSPVWCDISGRVLLALNYAIPACSLAQMRRLESVASTRRTSMSRRDRIRRTCAEIGLCIVFPLIMLPINYLFQGHRYDVVESIGCSIPTFFSWPGVAIRYLLPMVLSVIALILAILAVRWFIVRRLQFRSILARATSSLTVDRYLRLIALAAIDVSFMIIQDAISIYSTFSRRGDFVASKMDEDLSFSSIHYNFHQISQFPQETLSGASYVTLSIGFYSAPIYSIIFFAFFGFGEEAVSEYLAFGRRCVELLRWRGFLPNQRPLNEHASVCLGSKVVAVDEKAVPREADFDVSLMSPGCRSAIDSAGLGGVSVSVERSVV